MRLGSLLLAVVLVVGGLWLFGVLDFQVNDMGELPNVTIEGGRAPDVDVTVSEPDAEIRMEERTVEVPQVDVDRVD